MTTPNNLSYKESHEWIEIEEDGILKVGITHFAQEALGDIVFIELPSIGKKVNLNDATAVIESVKAASDIYAPASGEIVAVNDVITTAPEIINSEPYKSWLFKIKPSDESNFSSFLSAEQYQKLTG